MVQDAGPYERGPRRQLHLNRNASSQNPLPLDHGPSKTRQSQLDQGRTWVHALWAIVPWSLAPQSTSLGKMVQELRATLHVAEWGVFCHPTALTGRLKEIINRGGEKISPLEVDGFLSDHPAID